MKGSFSGIVLIVIGGIALAHNLGYLNINLAHLIRTWWPLILIVLGIGFFFTPNGGRRR
jgi:uncharacterized membrane-anchored protein